MKKLLLAATLSLCIIPSFATENDGYSKEYKHCMDNSGGVTINMLDCINAEHDKQDKLLNETYKKVMARLNAKQKDQLRKAQRTWIKWRQEDAEFLGNYTGGTIDRINSSSDYLQKTVDRVKFLNDLLPL